MKFSKTVQHLGEIDKLFGPHYIKYKLLKKYLKEITSTSSGEAQAVFVQLVENEHQRVKKLIEYKVAELQLQCSSIVTNIRILDSEPDVKKPEVERLLVQLTTHADQLAEVLAATDRFVYYNKEGFRKIVKKHDKLTHISLSWLEAQRLRTFFVHTESDLERLLVELSDIYKYIVQNTEGSGPGEHSVSDQTFERKSYKYWVAIEDVFKFKTKMIKHLPVHIFARTTDEKFQSKRKTVVDILALEDMDEDKTNYSKLGWISSVYFDTDDADCYRTRLNLEEGATLFRIRWYGDPNDVHRTDVMCLPRAPEKGCYYERKTHHESWVEARSLKERFPIRKSDIYPFMTGEVKPQDVVKDGPGLQLAEEMQGEIVRRKLHPVLRTVYKRTAFQQETTNDVRITLDTQLAFVNERWSDIEPGLWKRDEEEVEALGDWREFPFAVLEVKLVAAEPEWLSDILKEPYIRAVHKFSKFQQASCTFFPDKVHMFPYWFSEQDVADMKQRVKAEGEKRAKNGNIEKEDSKSVVSSSPELSNNAIVNKSFESSEMALTPFASLEEIKVFTSPEYQTDIVAMESFSKKKSSKWGSKWKRRVSKKKGGVGADGTHVSFGGIPGKQGKDKSKFATARVKIEPKTFFANERTFLQWLRSGLSLFSLGGILYGLGADQASIISGLVFSACALVICVYGLAIFYWRMYMIKNRRNQRFDDWFGPAMLATLIIGGLVTSVVLQQIQSNAAINNSTGVFGPQPAGLFNAHVRRPFFLSGHPISGLPAFTVPRDITPDLSDDSAAWLCAEDVLAKINVDSGETDKYIVLTGNVECMAVASVPNYDVLAVVVAEKSVNSGERQHAAVTLRLQNVVSKSSELMINLPQMSEPNVDISSIAFYPGLLRNYTKVDLQVNGTFIITTSSATMAIVLTKTGDPSAPGAVMSFSIPLAADSVAIHQNTLFLLNNDEKKLSVFDLKDGFHIKDIDTSCLAYDIAGIMFLGDQMVGVTKFPPKTFLMTVDIDKDIALCL